MGAQGFGGDLSVAVSAGKHIGLAEAGAGLARSSVTVVFYGIRDATWCKRLHMNTKVEPVCRVGL